MNPVQQKYFGIGIDTARYGHHVTFMDEQKRTAAKCFHFTENRAGYQALESAINKILKKHPNSIFYIRVDAAGQYAENLIQWLHEQPWPATISVGQPQRNAAYRNAHYDKRKADPAESLACARFAIVERPEAMHRSPAKFSVLRDAVAQMEASATARTRLINQLHNMLARAFPEMATIVNDIAGKSILYLIAKYPTAKRLAAARLDTIKKLPRIGEELAIKLHDAAKNSTASNRDETTELLIKRKVDSVLLEMKVHADLSKIVEKSVEELPAGPHRRVRSIAGIGPQTEAALLAKIVDIDRFRSASALIGYFGVFPEEYDVSGTNKDGTAKKGKVTKMSRKGNDLVRRLLYTAAQSAIRYNPPVRALFARLRAGGTEYNTAVGHCMAKLLRQVYAVWKKDCDFDPQWETRHQSTDQAEAQSTEENVAGHSQAQSPSRKVVTATKPIVARAALDFNELRALITMSDVLALLDWTAQRTSGGALRGKCPLHQSELKNDRAFAINLTKKVFCCHRCGAQGNALDLWAATQNLPIFEAAWDLVDRLKIAAPMLEKEKENCTA